MRSLKHLIVWIGLIAAVAVLNGMKGKVVGSRYLDAFSAKQVKVSGDGGVEFRKSPDGHFYVHAVVSGKNIKFLVDTGATDVVLSVKDARKLGSYLKSLGKTKTYTTANGQMKVALFQVPEIKVGNLVATNVRVSVGTYELKTSLLGMGFLKHFRFIMQKDKLILYRGE